MIKYLKIISFTSLWGIFVKIKDLIIKANQLNNLFVFGELYTPRSIRKLLFQHDIYYNSQLFHAILMSGRMYNVFHFNKQFTIHYLYWKKEELK